MSKSKIGITSKLAREYCERFHSAPTMQISRMLRRDHPLVYADIESARDSVRWARGERRNRDRLTVSNPIARLDIPAAEPSSFRIVELPDDVRRYLVISDVHVPYHDPESLAVAMDYARAKATRCDGVLINGDLIDFYQLSRFERDPRNRRVPEELESVGQVLDAIHVHLKPRRVVWKLGNHEKRWARYMRERAPELLGIPAFELASVLETEARGIMVVDANHVLKHRALYIMHGHELGGGGQSPVGPARTALLKATDCALIGHHHRTDQHSGNTIGGVTLTSWALGCLCDLHPEYAIVNRWCHGFATLDVGSDWKVDNKRIINGMVY